MVVVFNFNIGVVVGFVVGWVCLVNGDDLLVVFFGCFDVGVVGLVY